MDFQVVILAGGISSRLFPFNQHHKSLLSICGKPLIAYTLDSVKQAGFSEAIIVHGDNHNPDLVQQYAPKGFKLQFAVQKQPQGQGDAILSAKHLINQPFFVLDSQQFKFHLQIKPHLSTYQSSGAIAITLRKQTNTPEKYGIFKLDGDRVLDLVEKPAPGTEPSDWYIVGTYFYTSQYLEILSSIQPQQYSMEIAISESAHKGKVLALESKVEYSSLKYPWDLLDLKDSILDSLTPSISPEAKIAQTAIVEGDVTIEAGAQIHDFAIVQGPAYIGRDAVVGTYSQIRNHTVLEAGAQAERYCDIRGSLIGPGTHIHSEFVGDSVIGSNCRIGAGFVTGNKRFDRANIKIKVKDQLIDSGRNNIGALIGDNVHIGIHSSTMPGTIIGSDVMIGPNISVKGTHPSSSVISKSNL